MICRAFKVASTELLYTVKLCFKIRGTDTEMCGMRYIVRGKNKKPHISGYVRMQGSGIEI